MTLREYCRVMAQELTKAGIENGSFEAKQLCCFAFGISEKELLLSQEQLSGAQRQKAEVLLQKRCGGMPLQYLLGEWEFFSLPFFVGEGVLIPRQDTETLCEAALSCLHGKQGQKVIDLCSGSGCIAVTLDHYAPGNQVYALEKSKKALTYLNRNRKRNHSGIKIIEGDVLCPKTGESGFDVICSNPPYLSGKDMQKLQKEVSFEPEMALYAPNGGYYFYEEITRIWKDRLNPGGMLFYEIGMGQEERVSQILANNCFQNICFEKDICGIIRVVYAQKGQ